MPPPDSTRSGTPPVRVVVIDDSPDIALYTQAILEQSGCEVLALTDSAQALSTVHSFDPDVVVTDIEMPGVDGLELMASLRQDRPWLPVVVMTAHVSVEYAVSALRGQADEFLTKPVNPEQLVSVVHRLAGDARATREKHSGEVVLAIGAHPDDVELGVGATLAAHRAALDAIVILTLSRGGRGGDMDSRQHESLAAAEMLGARLFLEDLIDTQIARSDEALAVIERVVAEVSPTIVYTHSSHDRHQDHRAVHEATMVATRTIPVVGCYQSPSSTIDFRPNRFVAVDGYTDAKLRLLDCYRSQSGIRGYLEPDFVLATARYWSRFGTGKSAEPLEIIRDASGLNAAATMPVYGEVDSSRLMKEQQ
jgi:LmbE family N-acetylglucosaminyl deacetylase/CheY-like chemotaxis protein